MASMQKITFLSALLLMAALPASASDPARTQEAEPDTGLVQDEPKNLSMKPVFYTNETGDFQITFPGGCGKLVTKANEPDLWGGQEWSDIIQVTYVYCDRYQSEGEGCSVNATYNMPGDDGAMAGPQQVTGMVENYLKEFRAKVVEQHPIKKKFDNGVIVEGVELFAQAEEGRGEIWIRGLLTEGDIYILAAWNHQGRVWNNPDFAAFFNSFQPWTE